MHHDQARTFMSELLGLEELRSRVHLLGPLFHMDSCGVKVLMTRDKSRYRESLNNELSASTTHLIPSLTVL